MSLYLVRHGETAWSLSGKHTGRTDLPLTANGEDQARALAPWLLGTRFARVLTSPRLRARDTCRLVGLEAAGEIEPLLAEWDYGEYEGLRSADITRTRPGWNIFRDGCPAGETPDQVSDRADRVIAALDDAAGDVALFSHGHFGRAVALRWIGLPIAHGEILALSPATLGILGRQQGHATRAIVLWNADPGMRSSLEPAAQNSERRNR